ncbi:MAG: VWA domain-containing protein [Pseudomonadota bacterium]|nr:VWA domain-containing protein [Pseudomonadota bacterium]
MNLHDFHFLRPWWLPALPVGLLLLARLKRQEPGKSQWYKVCDHHLLEHLLVGEAKIQQKRVYSSLLIMLSLATLALAGPAWERLPQPLFRAAGGRVIVLDLSLSMLTSDISPSRLSRARYKAIDLAKAGIGIEQGVVVFAGDSFIVAPLTDDRATLLNLLPGLDTNTVPVQGSRADRGLEKAGKLLKRAAINRGQIILLADDADQQTITTARKLNNAGHRVDVIAVGTKNGAPITLADGSYLKDKQGQIVVPVPAFAKLREVAESGGGSYFEIDDPESSFQRLNKPTTLFPETKSQSELTGDQWLDRGPWLLIPLVLLAAICFRKGWLLILLMALFINPKSVEAQNRDNFWQNLWQRPTQQAAKAFAEEDFNGAAQLTKDPDWQAASLYRAGNFKESAAVLEPLVSSRAHYNRGNALAHSGELEKAIEAYDQALQADPSLEDARFNRELVEKLLQQQEEQENSKDGNQSQSENEDSKKENSENQDSEQNSDDPQQDSQHNQDSSEQQDQQESQPNSQSKPNQDDREQTDTDNSQPEPEQKEEKTPESETKEAKNSIEATEKEETGKPPEGMAAGEESDEKPMDAKQQALEQWLRRVPDDPRGLLEKKFLYQYRRRQNRTQGNKGW